MMLLRLVSVLRMVMLVALAALASAEAQTTTAFAPDSLAGYSYWATYGQTSIRTSSEVSVELNADGTYVEHWYRVGTDINSSLYGISGNYAAPGAGTYVYTKQSNTQGLLTFNAAGGTSTAWVLNFSGVGYGGIYTVAGGNGLNAIGGLFVLTKLDPTTRPMANISTLVQVHPGETTTIGFVVSNNGDYVIRVAGPALAQLGIANPWATPSFTLYESGIKRPLEVPSTGVASIYSQPWDSLPGLAATNTRAFQAVGAFPFAPGSNDTAAVFYLSPGACTVSISAAATDPGGAALVEIYNYQ